MTEAEAEVGGARSGKDSWRLEKEEEQQGRREAITFSVRLTHLGAKPLLTPPSVWDRTTHINHLKAYMHWSVPVSMKEVLCPGIVLCDGLHIMLT